MGRYARIALWLALITQIAWMAGQWVSGDGPGDRSFYDAVIIAAFVGLALAHGRVRWLNAGLRILVGLTFLGSVADRFGLLGAAGAAGVSWGDFDHFIAYTRSVNAFLPASWASTLAVVATIGESILGAMLIIGLRTRLAAVGAALLLLVFGSAMVVSLGIGAQFDYAVAVLAAGSWFLATVDSNALAVGSWRWRRISRPVASVRR